jgi:Arc/MetJ-type ribon-helix-helix transcriptional regulator
VKDVIVSVRMPRTMLDRLKELAGKNHYMDVSDEIRSVIREKTAQYASPYTQDVKRIVDDLQEELRDREKKDKRGEAIVQLKKLLEELEHDK